MKYDPILENLEKLPSVLYKYRVFDEQGYTFKMINNGEVFFSSARNFNDPFENYFIPQTKMAVLEGKELFNYIKLKTRQIFPDANDSERKKLESIAHKRAMMHKKNPSIIGEELHHKQFDTFGILSLAKECTSLPMWAYYSNNHQGVCVGFKTEVIGEHQIALHKEKRELLVLHDVEYEEKVPSVIIDTPLDGDESMENLEQTEKIHYTKSTQWKHENEIRLIKWHGADEAYSFGASAIAEVIIGLRASDEDKSKLIEEINKLESKPSIKQAIKSQDEYGLVFEQVDL